MAKYTELLKDYLKDHELPTIFNEIEGLADLFTDRYFDSELAFETEELFTLKLEHSANMLVPTYKKKLQQYDDAIESIYNNKRKTTSKTTDLPIDSTDAEPSQTGESEETGASITDAIARVKFLQDSRYNVMNDLLEQFKPLFMLIY